MRFTIRLRDEATLRTGAGGISGVNQLHDYPCESSFILDKLPQLTERPRVLLSPLCFPNRDAVSDVGKVFKGDTSTAVFSLCNNILTNYVVYMSSKPLFFLGPLFEKSLCLFRAIGLKFRAKLGMAFSESVNLIPRVNFPIRVGNYVHNTQVYTQKAIRLIWCWLRGINHDCQIEGAITKNKVGLSHLPIKSSFLICPNPDRDYLATFESKYGNFIQPLPREDSLVINHRRVGFEIMHYFSISLVALRNSCNRSYCHLGGKPVMLPKVAIDHVMKVILPKGKSLKSLTRCVVTSFVETLHSLKKRLVLLWARGKFNHQSLLHNYIVEDYSLQVKYLTKGGMGGFLCQINQAVSTARFL